MIFIAIHHRNCSLLLVFQFICRKGLSIWLRLYYIVVSFWTKRELVGALILLSACLCQPSAALAQSDHVYEHLTKDIHSNFGRVKSLYRSTDGLLWIGSQPNGISYYDGKNISHVPLEGERYFTNQNEIFTAGEDVLYLNLDREVAVFDCHNHSITQRITLPEGLIDVDKIAHLAYSKNKNESLLWIILSPHANAPYRVLLSKNHQPFQWVKKEEIKTEGYLAIAPFFDHLLLKRRTGFEEIDQQGNTVREVSLKKMDLRNVQQQHLSFDGIDALWFDRPDGADSLKHHCIRLYRDSSSLVFSSPRLPVANRNWNRIQADRGYLFTNQSSLKIIDGSNFKTIYSKLVQRGTRVQCSLWDDQGTLWVGDLEGLAKISFSPTAFKNFPSGQNRGMTENEEGVIYIGNDGDKFLRVIDPVIDSFYQAPLPKSYIHIGVFSPISHEKGIFGSSRFIKFEENSQVEIFIPRDYDHVFDKEINLLDRKGQLWGMFWYSSYINVVDIRDKDSFRRVDIPALKGKKLQMNALYQRPSDGTVWLGTQGGGAFVFSENGKLLAHHHASPNSKVKLKNNVVTSFLEDDHEQLWIGHGAGLSCLNATSDHIKHFEIVPDEEHFNLVYGILPEDNKDGPIEHLWLSTNRGLYHFNIQTAQATGFPMNDKLMNTEFNRLSYLKAKNGRFYFGSNNSGIYAFYPEEVLLEYEQLMDAGKNLPVIINSYSKYDGNTKKVITPANPPQSLKEIKLGPKDRYFDLSFTVADFRKPSKNWYTYMLEGYDENWKPPTIGQNSVHYENLRPGTYTLKLRGGLFKSVLPYNERSIKVRILPFWYETWWAIGMYILLFLTAVYLIYRSNLNRQLEKQEAKRIKELDKFKSRFYTNITHEFRTPLTVISGISEELASNNEHLNVPAAEKQRIKQGHNLIQRNSKNLLRLVNQLLELARIGSGAIKMNLIQADILYFLRYLTESFASMAAEKEITLTFHSEIDQLIMDFDEDKIQHIAYNLLSNAIKFTPMGGAVDFLVNKTEDRGNSYLQIEVKDTGIGISEEQLPFIFDRFYQTDSSTTRKGEGTGIGLALTKELIELMNGHIQVQSILNKGSIFTALLPVTQEAVVAPIKMLPLTKDDLKPYQAPEKPAVQSINSPIASPTNGELPILLIIEDNADVVAYLQSILQKAYQIEIANDGQAGIDKALEIIPDIIITDVMMPEKDGYEVCDTLKTDERSSHIPIIMLTAKAAESDRLVGLKTGADAYLMKPFNKEELFIRLEKLVELRKALQQRYSEAAGPLGILATTKDEASKEPSLDDQFMEKILQIIDEKIGDADLDIPYLCQEVHLSSTQLFRKMKALTGEPPIRFIRRIRLNKAKELLQTTDLNVSEIAYDLGFTDPHYFSRAFSKEFGSPPSAFQ